MFFSRNIFLRTRGPAQCRTLVVRWRWLAREWPRPALYKDENKCRLFSLYIFLTRGPKRCGGPETVKYSGINVAFRQFFALQDSSIGGKHPAWKNGKTFLLCCSEINIMYIHRPYSVLIKCCSSSLLCSKSLLYYQEIFTSSLLWLAGNCFLTWSHAPQFPAQCTLAPPCQFWKITQLFFEKWTPMVRKTHTNWQKITYLFAEKHTPNVL